MSLIQHHFLVLCVLVLAHAPVALAKEAKPELEKNATFEDRLETLNPKWRACEQAEDCVPAYGLCFSYTAANQKHLKAVEAHFQVGRIECPGPAIDPPKVTCLRGTCITLPSFLLDR